MTPQDITIFQVLAFTFTLSFVVLIVMFWHFLRGLEEARHHFVNLTSSLERHVEPILTDLREGSAHFRVAGEKVRRSATQVAELGDTLSQLVTITQTGAKGVWAMVAKTVGSYLRSGS